MVKKHIFQPDRFEHFLTPCLDGSTKREPTANREQHSLAWERTSACGARAYTHTRKLWYRSSRTYITTLTYTCCYYVLLGVESSVSIKQNIALRYIVSKAFSPPSPGLRFVISYRRRFPVHLPSFLIVKADTERKLSTYRILVYRFRIASSLAILVPHPPYYNHLTTKLQPCFRSPWATYTNLTHTYFYIPHQSGRHKCSNAI